MRFDVPTLSVERTERGLRLRLDVPATEAHAPLQEELHQRVEPGAIERLASSAAEVLRGGERPRLADEARVRGGVLYRTVIPPPLRARIAALAGPMLVSSPLPEVPWEMFHDGREFWGLRYALGRRLVTERPLAAVPTVRLPARPRALVIGADPLGDLRFVSREMEEVCRALAPMADVVAVAGPLATFEVVTAHLGRAFDLIHFAGHIVRLPGGESALVLGDGRPLPASVIEPTLAGRPLVFLNGCASAQPRSDEAAGRDRQLSAAVHAFLFGGAAAAIGTLSDVGDRHAAALARAFYRHVFAETAVGEALRRARAECRSDAETSPTWLSFGLHGTPALTLVARDAASPTSAPAAAAGLSRRAFLATAAGAAIAAVGAGVLVGRLRSGPARTKPTVVGVMQVRVRAGDVPPWMRAFTRYALTAALREVSALSIYSQEKIDFLCESQRLCGIAGAEALGMGRMITVSMSRVGNALALDAEVIDVARNGLLELTERVQGRADELIDLQNRLVFRLLEGLHVHVTESEHARILSERTSATLDGYRMLMETLGAPPAGGPASSRHRLPGIGAAWAAAPDEAAIRDVLVRYQEALTRNDLDGLAALQPQMPPAQRDALRRYFENARDLEVRFSEVEVLVEGDQALAMYVREDRFVDVRSGRPMHLKIPVSSRLVKQGERWLVRVP